MRNAVVSWTGGKDGCLSCYKAMQEGWRVNFLLSFRNISRIGSHDINPELILAQSEAIGIPLIHREFTSYEQEFKRTILDLRANGEKIDGAVFGHIQTHKKLVDRICTSLNLDLLLPLWQQDSRKILKEITGLGFEVIVISVKDGLMGREWLGRRIDEEFSEDLKDLDQSIDPCGENGEFDMKMGLTHTYAAAISEVHVLTTSYPAFSSNLIIDRSFLFVARSLASSAPVS
mgnify:FL=1